MQYSNFKDTLQNIASQIGNVEQEVEEHKYVSQDFILNYLLSWVGLLRQNRLSLQFLDNGFERKRRSITATKIVHFWIMPQLTGCAYPLTAEATCS